MKSLSTAICLALLACMATGAVGGGSLVTVRIGEQDTCDVTGATTLTWDAKAGQSHIRFDTAKLPANAQVKKAVLRFWVDATDPNGRPAKTWGFARWSDPKFDGFAVWEGAERVPGKELDTRFPFNTPTFWCCEFDVTGAVRRWAADPAANRGLGANFPFPVAPDGKPEEAWQRPYLQVTYAGPNPNRPGPPTELKARTRSGQVFLTWKQIRHDGAFFDSTYRVYRHTEAVTPANLGQAELLGEVHRLSQFNYRRTMTARGTDYGPWRYYVMAAGQPAHKKGESHKERRARVLPLIPERFNYVVDGGWPQRVEGGQFLEQPKAMDAVQLFQGPQLGNDAGLFVHTVREAGPAWFAVTSVLEGNENRQEIASAGPVEAKVAEPEPVLQAVFTANAPGGYGKIGKFHVREYVYWEGGTGRFHTEASTPFCFTYRVPLRWVGLGHDHGDDTAFPAWVVSCAKIAGYSFSYWDGRGITMDTGYMPPTRLAPFPPAYGPNIRWPEMGRVYYGSRTPPQEPAGRGGYVPRSVYGYVETLNTMADMRKATVQPYFENRRLFELGFVLRRFPADPNYVRASGEGSTLNFAVHHAEHIATVQTAQERPWTSPRGAEGHAPLVGLREWALKNEHGVSVWDWNDPVWHARKSPGRHWPFISICHSDNYDGSDHWKAVGFPGFYLDLARFKQGAELWWCDIGDAPSGKAQAVPRNMPYPVLTRVTCCETPAENWRDEPRGTLNGYVVWHRPTQPFAFPRDLTKTRNAPAPPAGRAHPYTLGRYSREIRWAAHTLDLVDRPDRFEMAFLIGDDGLVLNGQSVPPCRVACGAADITPRRLQQLKPQKGTRYLWRNVKVATGQLLQAGAIEPDEHGLLTVPQFLVDKDVLGNKLIIEPLGGRAVPTADRAQKVQVAYFRNRTDRHHEKNQQVDDLAYADYLARCREPELVPVARPDKLFRIGDFVNAGGFRDGGLYSQWGGGFDDSYNFPKAGRYRIDLQTTKSLFQNGAWPILTLSIDDRALGEHQLDSEQAITRSWWTDLTEGRHRVRFRLANNVFNEPVPRNGDQSPKPDRGFSLVGVRFVPLGEPPAAAETVHEVQIRQRSLVVGVGVPIRLGADVRSPWGDPVAKPQVVWKASEGAAIAADGVLTATKPGRCTVTASAGGKSDTVAVAVQGDSWFEDFDDEWADGWAPVAAARNAQDAAQWMVTRHHGFVGALVQRNRRSAAAHLVVWEGGSEWRDVALQADRLLEGEGFRSGAAQGVVFRFQDPGNHYRFERRSGKEGTTFRLVKVLAGKETVLGTAAKDASPLPMKRSDYPSFQHWGDRYRNDPKPFPVDRFAVEVRGGRITAKMNDKEVLTATDADLKQGTIGLWCQGEAAFDNIRVKPLGK